MEGTLSVQLSSCTCTITVPLLKLNRGAHWNMSTYGYRDAYWNEGAYSVGALIDKNKFEGALILEGGR